MDSVPFFFVREVASLLQGSAALQLEQLTSRLWANEAARHVRGKRQYSLIVVPPSLHDPDYRLLLSRQKSTGLFQEYIKIDDFDTFDVGKDVVWTNVLLRDHVPSRKEYVSRTSNVESFTKCLRRILGGRDCVQLDSGLGEKELMKCNLLALLPRTFQSIIFREMNREVEEFIIESMELQKVSQLSLKGSEVSKEFESFLHRMVASAQLSRMSIHIDSIGGFDFCVFESVLQRWMKDPVGFNSRGKLSLAVPVRFGKEKLEAYLKEVSVKERCGEFHYERVHPLKTSEASVTFDTLLKNCFLIICRISTLN
uniref:F-box domain-containing protein n=1 Tax=Steinernema glaseri TaxID=37863 RepID=A0A1I8A036_9BILA